MRRAVGVHLVAPRTQQQDDSSDEAEEVFEEEIFLPLSPSPVKKRRGRKKPWPVNAEPPPSTGTYDLSALHTLLAARAAEEEEEAGPPSGRLEDSIGSEDAASARLTELAGTSSSFSLTGSSSAFGSGSASSSLAVMVQAAKQQQQATATAADMERAGLGHLSCLLPAAHDGSLEPFGPSGRARMSSSPPLPLLLPQPPPPPPVAAGFGGSRGLNLQAPSELVLPDDRSEASSTAASPFGAGRRCTPVLRRARVRSPDEDDGIMARMPRDGARPGEHWPRRRRPRSQTYVDSLHVAGATARITRENRIRRRP